jgi:hypothetical protein
MGSYCELYLAGYHFDTSKSYINPFWSCIFKENDRRSRQVCFSEYYAEPIDDTDMVPSYEYAASAATIKLRLELLGYTLDKTRLEYTEKINEQIGMTVAYLKESREDFWLRDLKYLNELKSGGFSHWVDIVRHIFKINLTYYQLEHGRDRSQDDISTWILDDNEEMFLRFPDVSYGYLLRAVLETVDADDELRLDITPLVIGGYYDENDPVCEMTARGHINSTIEFQKIVLLTEGTTDSYVLSESLKLLYPQLYYYFSFMDFDTVKPEGGSSALERTVKSFAAAGINNKIVAIFDNDAAGINSIQRLKKTKLPNNIRVMPLPDLPLAANYPTIGAQGKTMEDINGRACSIELYFGTEILTIDAKLIPVSWRNLEHGINRYQGEILDKSMVQKRFYEKLNLATKNGLSDEDDWSGLKLIFQTLFKLIGSI